MSIIGILFLFRLLGAILLLTFGGTIGWLMYQDLLALTHSLGRVDREHGILQVISVGEEESSLAINDCFPLLPVTSLGRSYNNSITVPDEYASSEHLLITLRGRQWWLEDLASRNGTLLNNLPVQQAVVVSSGDVVTIGDTQFKLLIHSMRSTDFE